MPTVLYVIYYINNGIDKIKDVTSYIKYARCSVKNVTGYVKDGGVPGKSERRVGVIVAHYEKHAEGLKTLARFWRSTKKHFDKINKSIS